MTDKSLAEGSPLSASINLLKRFSPCLAVLFNLFFSSLDEELLIICSFLCLPTATSVTVALQYFFLEVSHWTFCDASPINV